MDVLNAPLRVIYLAEGKRALARLILRPQTYSQDNMKWCGETRTSLGLTDVEQHALVLVWLMWSNAH